MPVERRKTRTKVIFIQTLAKITKSPPPYVWVLLEKNQAKILGTMEYFEHDTVTKLLLLENTKSKKPRQLTMKHFVSADTANPIIITIQTKVPAGILPSCLWRGVVSGPVRLHPSLSSTNDSARFASLTHATWYGIFQIVYVPFFFPGSSTFELYLTQCLIGAYLENIYILSPRLQQVNNLMDGL